MYVVHQGDFDEFELKVRTLLRQGLVAPALVTAFTSWEGPKALLCFGMLALEALLSLPLRMTHIIASLAGWGHQITLGPPRFRRFASRTTILERTIDRLLFEGAVLSDLADNGRPKWTAVATELRTGSAFYFGAKTVGSWRLGRINPARVTIAHAVTASAAFPLLLPALDDLLTFEKPDGARSSERITLTDGGVYDNLGLATLWPDRDPAVSLDVEPVDTIIACRAGDGLRMGAPSLFFLARMSATVATIHERAQNAAMKRLFDLKKDGRLRSFVLPYLGQVDARLREAPADLVPRDEVTNYPTDFSPMTEDWIERLSRRGEQLTLALVRENAPELLPASV